MQSFIDRLTSLSRRPFTLAGRAALAAPVFAALLSACGGADENQPSATAESVRAPERARALAVAADPAAVGAVGTFSIPHTLPDAESTNTAISLAFLNDHVAGSKGQIKAVGRQLFAGSDRIRLYGVNMPAGAAIPTKADAVKIAARLKKEGYNAVRLISFDRELAKANTFTVTHQEQGILNTDHTLNATAVDMMDHFVYQLQQAGIYVHIVLHNARVYPGATGCDEYCQGIDNVVPWMVQSQKDFASMLLGHVNPYTGRAYKNDPGVFAIEINNESSLSHRWSNGTIDKYLTDSTLYSKYGTVVETKFRDFLRSKYTNVAALNTAWGSSWTSFDAVKMPLKANASTLSAGTYRDVVQFNGDTEAAYHRDMMSYLKNTLGVTALVMGTQNNYVPRFAFEGDLSDVHSYVGNNPVQQSYNNPSNGWPVYEADNRSVLAAANPHGSATITGVFGVNERKDPNKPGVITEYAYRFGNQYLAEMEPLLAYYAGFQDLGALFVFNQHNMNLNTNKHYYTSWYNNSVNSLTRVASVLAYRRGDYTVGEPKINKVTKETFLAKAGSVKSYTLTNFHFGGNIRAITTQNVHMQIVNSTAEEQIVSEGAAVNGVYTTSTGQLKWTPQDRILIDSPRSKAAVGYFYDTSVPLGSGITVNVGKTMNRYAVASIVSLNNGSLPSTKMLLTLGGHFTVPGEYPRNPGDKLFSWGNDYPRIEAVPATVRITTPLNLKVTALDRTGAPKADVAVVRSGSDIVFVTGPALDTGWYLIEDAAGSTTNVAPSVTVSAPASATVGSAVTLSASASDSDGTVTKVDFYDGSTLIGTDTTSPYSLSWTPSSTGSHSITARATDDDGAATTSAVASVSVSSASNAAPTVSLSAPANATVGVAATLSATAADSDGTIAKVEFFDGTTLIGTDTTSPYSVSWTPGTAGTRSITARATDNGGAATTSSAVSVNVASPSNSPPTVSLTSVPASATTGVAVTLAATAADSDGTVAKVEFFDGTTLIGTDTTSPYSVSWTPATVGTRSITARVTDNAGAATTSAAASVAVSAPAAGSDGLSASYWANTSLSGAAVLSRVEAPNFNWASASPATGVPSDHWSARWSGSLAWPSTGTYTLQVIADDGIRVWVNGQQQVDSWTNGGNKYFTLPAMSGTAGQSVPIVIEHYDGTGNSTVQLRWKTPSSGAYFVAVPGSSLSPTSSGSGSLPNSGGLLGYYYPNTSLSGAPILSYIEPVNVSWSGSATPGASLYDNWSVRWTGRVVWPTSGTYALEIIADDGIRVALNGTQVVNKWSNGGNATYTLSPVTVTAGSNTPITIEHYEGTGATTVQLRWKVPGSAYFTAIPAGSLSPY